VALSGTLLLLLLISPSLQTGSSQSLEADARFKSLALEASEWAISFQVRPSNSSWGLPYADQRAWGTNPYYYQNATITGGRDDIPSDRLQTLAYLIGGHDAGGGAAASLEALAATGNRRWLEAFLAYQHHFRTSQIPSPLVSTLPVRVIETKVGPTIIDESGYWAEQVSVSAGPDRLLGTSDDVVELRAAFPSPEHGNPIAYSLILYYKLTGDRSSLASLERYGSWLVRSQVKSGNYSGAFPVTQERFAGHDWKPRMYETSQSAWILAELFEITGNRTLLEAAIRSGNYMLAKQYHLNDWNDHLVDGALPYEWNRTDYNPRVSSNHAGYALLAWTRLNQITGNATYLYGIAGSPASSTGGAVKYANWLLSWQVTPHTYSWGDHRYAYDPWAIGGFYYGYDPVNHTFGWRVAQSLWSASTAIKGLLALYVSTHNETYKRSAELAAEWLSKMRHDDDRAVRLQALGGWKTVRSSWWGKYAQFYQPDQKQLELKNITKFVERGLSEPESIRQKRLTELEKLLGVEWNLVDFEMAARGERYQKMVWSWWPSAGFEPRYGSDIALGLFAISNYHNASALLRQYDRVRLELAKAKPPADVVEMTSSADQLREKAMAEFKSGWYLPAILQLEEALIMLTKSKSAYAAYEADRARFQISVTLLAIGAIAIVALARHFRRRWVRRISCADMKSRFL